MSFEQLFIKMLLAIIFSTIIIAEAKYKCPEGRLTSRQREGIVRQHNEFRSKLIHGKLKNKDDEFMPKGKNMLKMTWSCELEYSAQRWADKCIFSNSLANRQEEFGENIHAYWSSRSVEKEMKNAVTNVGKMWWNELENEYPNNPSNKFSWDIPDEASHFTQMAWAKTHEIGCGIANCDHSVFVVCHYSPIGNEPGLYIYELGNPCKKNTDCDTGKCSKKTGLCKK